jgi:carboxymethylenebutenolidase
MASTVTLTSKIDNAEITALHAEPAGARRGGIILIQEIFGLDQFVQADVELWASLGFEVVAPSMFDRQEKGFTADHSQEGMQKGFGYMQANGWDNPISDVQACVDLLSSRGPVFIAGYCYGGSVAFLAACKIEGLAAASCYYGGFIANYADMKPLCPTICHFGRLDDHIPMTAVESIRAAHPDVPVYDYEAGHGFNNKGGAGYYPEASELARQRTLDLFAQNGAK